MKHLAPVLLENVRTPAGTQPLPSDAKSPRPSWDPGILPFIQVNKHLLSTSHEAGPVWY